MSGTVTMHSVFVYGSLMADDVVRLLLNRIPQTASATLPDLFSIKGRVYPAIIPAKSDKVSGKVLFGITDDELNVLDEFEDVEYERENVQVLLTDSSDEKLQTKTYVWAKKDDPDLYGTWDFEEWKQLHMEGFLKMTKEFAEELNLPKSEI
ncbi:AIG2-like (avirulence induced gene) family protein [Arabidopsis thaliana]|uniref:Putative gamma-glutamylcyclotransferase n=1 Tax=Arabidopsis thaliana TaxID=3702 RepID=F4IPN4_ARATH|nr:AIG2-like (avirulence induced gene) family protein [Arabidopsis thaliana]AEC07569.1 AIG2-like (avirulence induced gene) family protein [Arabidopsis thaliana]|eukprot:NP_001077953.1 AIG2-like (avirulence induced gene) family protein [Arabidopsis thaliana]